MLQRFIPDVRLLVTHSYPNTLTEATFHRRSIRTLSIEHVAPKTSTERVRDFRARQRAKLEAIDGGGGERDPETMLLPAIEATIGALKLDAGDGAAVALARTYARVIDEAQDQGYAARWIGPHLLDALIALRATPAARAVPLKSVGRAPGGTGANPNKVQQLRLDHMKVRGRRSQD